MDWGTFDQFKFENKDADEQGPKDEEDEDDIDIIGQMTKFAFDSAVGNMKKIGVVMFIESKLVIPKVEKTCQFLTMKIDDTISYANLVQTLELIIGEYQSEKSESQSNNSDDKKSSDSETDSRCYGNIILKLLEAFKEKDNSSLQEVRLTRQTMYDGALLRSDQIQQA